MRLLCASVVAVLLVAVVAQPIGEVEVINDQSELDAFVGKYDAAMVEFYAPWCGHCKKLAPEYDAAAKELEKDDTGLAKVDCTDEEKGGKEVCAKYEVRGYPTLKFFQNGKDSPYEQERSKDAIVKYIRSRMGPAITVLDADSAEKFSTKDDLVMIQFSDEISDEYNAAASSMRDKMTFGHLADKAAAEALGADWESITLFRTFDEPQVKFEDEVTAENLATFVTANSFPLVGEIGPQNYKDYMDRGLPLMWIAVEKSTDEVIDWVREHAAKFAGKLSMVHIDGVQFESHIKNLGHEGDLPGIIITTDGNKKYLLQGDVTKESVATFLTDYDEGKLNAFLKSQDIPEDNDGPVTVLVGKSFDDLVINNDNDVLVEFYAPWCGHCKKLEPEYDDLGDRWSSNDKVVIAKMDSTENDGPIEISGFPTLVFFKSGNKDGTPETYKGERTADALDEFLKNNAVNADAGGDAEADAATADKTEL